MNEPCHFDRATLGATEKSHIKNKRMKSPNNHITKSTYHQIII